MRAQLPEWYKLVQIEPRINTIQAMVAATATFAPNLTVAKVPEFVRIAFHRSAVDEATRTEFTTLLTNADAAFGFPNDGREIGILASDVLMVILETEKDTQLVRAIALTLETAAASTETDPLVPQLLSYAKALTRKLARTTRATDRDFDAGWPDASREKAPPEYEADAALWAKATTTSLNSLLRRNREIGARTSQVLRAISEPVDAMWWLLGGVSAVTEKPLSSLPVEAVGYIIGHDLAGLSRYSLPLPAFEGLARQAVRISGIPEDAVELHRAAAMALGVYRDSDLGIDPWKLDDRLDSIGDVLPALSAIYTATSGHTATDQYMKSLCPGALASQVALEYAALHALTEERA